LLVKLTVSEVDYLLDAMRRSGILSSTPLLAQVREVVRDAFARAAANADSLVSNMDTIKVAPIKPTIPIELLERVDIRVGTIKLVEDVAGSNKLVKLTVDFGDHSRTILVGMKQEREQPGAI
jgi:tRNA-binding EMAP/Myf-like protein